MRSTHFTQLSASALWLAACTPEAPTAPSQLQLVFQGCSEGEIEPCG
jgi:hypothetical protein